MFKFKRLPKMSCILLFLLVWSMFKFYYSTVVPDTEVKLEMPSADEEERTEPEDVLAQYNKLLLEETSRKLTVDCKSWTPVDTSKHPFVLPSNLQEMQKRRLTREDAEHRRESFKKIFDEKIWFKENPSGAGSTLKATKNIKASLNAVIDRIKIHLKKDKISVLDSSCGDMTWMPSFLSSRSDVEYTGYDIVEANINNHREKFRDTDWKFEVHDIVTDPIKIPYDLIISRHTTQHLAISDAVTVIRNFVDSSSKFLLTTSFPNLKLNKELNVNAMGRYIPYNLNLDPFYLPPPICLTLDANYDEDHIMLWDLSTISLQKPST